ncbi:IS66 family insertion sequence element accessory protein TnpB [Escherichia coli]|nr:IS66 family insertion sequence element accessory protein TnpB [Escherichia coli]MBZ8712127.1 IS66 family insertion sequence element accessory protein TnpB [Escherichia coli]MBZ8716859.1 IS66 family insertion sequence element accessory protein TnpB [Escherichia coli]MBZ8727633.1 IS66 family insertion sequence element accessory protein TnpB [Escherichia coli]MBZ8732828.1 IS66 family insertion sequence element accessory protein TnpB [Escherichia coli]
MLRTDNVYLVIKPVDMRRGIDTLTQYVQNELNAAWHDNAAFVFTNKARSRIKVLRRDKHGVWLRQAFTTSHRKSSTLTRIYRPGSFAGANSFSHSANVISESW